MRIHPTVSSSSSSSSLGRFFFRALAFALSICGAGYAITQTATAHAEVAAATPLAPAWTADLGQSLSLCEQEDARGVVLLVRHESPTPESTCLIDCVDADLLAQSGWRSAIAVTPTQGPEAGARWQAITQLADEYRLRTIPSLVVLDAKGQPLACVESLPQDAAAWQSLCNQMTERLDRRNAALLRATDETGTPKAQALNEALGQVGRYWRSHYSETAQAIVDLDPDGALGLRDRYQPGLIEDSLDAGIQERVYPLVELADYDGARKQLQLLMDELPLSTGQTQLLRAFQAQLLYTQGDLEGAIASLHAAIAMAPGSAEAERVRSALAQLEELESLAEEETSSEG